MAEKLTKAEWDLLQLAAQCELEISDHHPVAATLAEKGLLAIGGRTPSRSCMSFSRSAHITDAGRAALQPPVPPSDRLADERSARAAPNSTSGDQTNG